MEFMDAAQIAFESCRRRHPADAAATVVRHGGRAYECNWDPIKNQLVFRTVPILFVNGIQPPRRAIMVVSSPPPTEARFYFGELKTQGAVILPDELDRITGFCQSGDTFRPSPIVMAMTMTNRAALRAASGGLMADTDLADGKFVTAPPPERRWPPVVVAAGGVDIACTISSTFSFADDGAVARQSVAWERRGIAKLASKTVPKLLALARGPLGRELGVKLDGATKKDDILRAFEGASKSGCFCYRITKYKPVRGRIVFDDRWIDTAVPVVDCCADVTLPIVFRAHGVQLDIRDWGKAVPGLPDAPYPWVYALRAFRG